MNFKLVTIGASLTGGIGSVVVGSIIYSGTQQNVNSKIKVPSTEEVLVENSGNVKSGVSYIDTNSRWWKCRIFETESGTHKIKGEIKDQSTFLNEKDHSFKDEIEKSCSGENGGLFVTGELYGQPEFSNGGGVRYVIVSEEEGRWSKPANQVQIWNENKDQWSSLGVSPDLQSK